MTGSSRRSFLGMMAALPVVAPIAARAALLLNVPVSSSVATLNGYAASRFSVALDVDGYVTGLTVADLDAGSIFAIRADRFVMAPRLSISDLASVAPKADASATAAVFPAAAVAPHSDPALTGDASAPAAASSGVAAFSPAAQAVLAGIALGVCLRASISSVTAFATAAANEIVSNSKSSVGA